MTFLKSFLDEMEREALTTRKMLDRVPDEKFDWKPHEKSMSLAQLVTHVAEIPSWYSLVLDTPELNFATTPYEAPAVKTKTELLSFFEKNLDTGRKALTNRDDSALDGTWTMRDGETIFFTERKDIVLRETFSQVVHHRAQLGVYLRLLNIPIPGSYGPSADEMQS